ncbi:lipoyl(octanoyl) transferase LipB [Derxia gummosa]|uniref:Lipoyl(Octanoyl) transferase LipB n=1 Tax=Derxia gummosa DSM 723 TaxID=1121388 RepID=A0AC36KLD6_9BURK
MPEAGSATIATDALAAGNPPPAKRVAPFAPVVRRLGRVPYEPTVEAMRELTAARTPDTPDEVWVLEHEPVYTLGQAGKPEHLLRANGIPMVQTDRGGQITYHGPGQVIVYLMVDLRRRGYLVKEAVQRIEQAVIDTLARHGIAADRKAGAPGVYLLEPGPDGRRQPGAKIAALGLRVRNGCTYHGVALNVAMDLAPFADINPCGYAGLETTDMAHAGVALAWDTAATGLADELLRQIGRPA